MNRVELIAALEEKFPDVAQSGLATRSQILAVTSYIPQWLNAAKIDRGLYSINDRLTSATEQKSVNVESMICVSNDVLTSTINVETFDPASLIPLKDPMFVPFGNYSDIKQIIVSKIFYPVYVYGPTGNGKSTMIEQVCANLKRPVIRVNLNQMTDEDQLIGSKTLEDGNIKIVEGPMLIGMRYGIPVILDELDAGHSNLLLALNPILESRPYYFKLKNEIIKPASGFNIFATANTKGKGSDDGRYIGTNVLNEAFLERFAATFEQEYPSAKVEFKIITNLMNQLNCVDETFASDLVKWADAIRRTFDDGGVDENITTRRIVHIVKSFAVFRNKKKAVELCINRFDVNTKSAFLDLFEKVSSGELQPTENFESNLDGEVAF